MVAIFFICENGLPKMQRAQPVADIYANMIETIYFDMISAELQVKNWFILLIQGNQDSFPKFCIHASAQLFLKCAQIIMIYIF